MECHPALSAQQILSIAFWNDQGKFDDSRTVYLNQSKYDNKKIYNRSERVDCPFL